MRHVSVILHQCMRSETAILRGPNTGWQHARNSAPRGVHDWFELGWHVTQRSMQLLFSFLLCISIRICHQSLFKFIWNLSKFHFIVLYHYLNTFKFCLQSGASSLLLRTPKIFADQAGRRVHKRPFEASLLHCWSDLPSYPTQLQPTQLSPAHHGPINISVEDVKVKASEGQLRCN